MSMNASQIRVVDPVLTTHARGYSNAEFVGRYLFPRVDVPTRGFQRLLFDRAAFKRQNTRRAPGTDFEAIEMGYQGDPVKLQQHARLAKTPIEHQDEGMVAPGLNLQMRKVSNVQQIIGLSLECAQADLARNPANYDAANKIALAGTAKFSHPDSDPLAIYEGGKEVIRKRIGRDPNLVLAGATVKSALKRHEMIKGHYAHTTARAITSQMLADYFEVENFIVGNGIYDVGGQSFDIWGDDMIIAYVPPEQSADVEVPAFGYTYSMAMYPMVGAIELNSKNDSWENKVKDEWEPLIVGKDAGYLIQAAV